MCLREREREKREGREGGIEKQQAGIRASQSGSERAPDSRVEREKETERG